MTTYNLPEPDLLLEERVKIRQMIDRQWRGYLTVYEQSILGFIFDRTIAWGKSLEKIAFREFTNGRGMAFTGTGIGRSTVIKTLENLVYLGTIVKKCNGKKAGKYGINIAWDPEEAALLPPSKHNRKVYPRKPSTSRVLSKSVSRTTPSTSREPLIKEPSIKDPSVKDRASEPSASSLPRGVKIISKTEVPRNEGMEAAIAGAERVAKARLEKQRVKSLGSLNVNTRQREWDLLFRENWPDAPCLPWSPKTRGLFKHAVKNKAFDGINAGEFFEWVIEDWGLLQATKFAWMHDAPVSPLPETVMIHIYKFLAAYADRMTLRNTFDVEGPARTRLGMRRQGFSAEAADKRIATIREGRERYKSGADKLEAEREQLRREKADWDRKKRNEMARLQNLKANAMSFAKRNPNASPHALQPLPKINFDED